MTGQTPPAFNRPPIIAPETQPARSRLLGILVWAGAPFAPEATVAEAEDNAYYAGLETARTAYVEQVEHEGLGEAVRNMHERRYALTMPTFAEQLDDPTRTHVFHDNRDGRAVTEHEGLEELDALFERLPAYQSTRLRESMHLLLRHEFTTASTLAALYIKSCLLENPELQVCLPTLASALSHEAKSDSYVLDAIMANFTDAELGAYQDRIVFNIEDISAPLNRVRILMPDDYIVTGVQRQKVYDLIREKYSEEIAAKLEQLTLAAPPRYLERTVQMPVTSCYVFDRVGLDEPSVLSSHSTPQYMYDPGYMDGEMYQVMRRNGMHPYKDGPSLLFVHRPYDSSTPTPNTDRAGRILGVRNPIKKIWVATLRAKSRSVWA